MLTLRIITVGTLKEGYWRDAVAEYKKRLSGFCRVEEINLKESKLPEDPSPAQIASALEAEGEAMKEHLPPRAYKIALCVEGSSFLPSSWLPASTRSAHAPARSVLSSARRTVWIPPSSRRVICVCRFPS